METKKWYVNQKVWDKTVSDEAGEIIDILEDCFYPVKVFFNHRTIYYDLSGRSQFNKMPTLSTAPYEIKMEGFSQGVEEEELPKKGQLAYGSNVQDGLWEYGYFIKKNEDGKYELSPRKNATMGIDFCQITTKNPYEVEEDRELQIGDMVYAWDDENPSWIGVGILTDVQLLGGIRTIYVVGEKSHWKHCSLKSPLIK